MPDMIGKSREELIQTLGQPLGTEYLPNGVMCEQEEPVLRLDYSKPPPLKRCMLFDTGPFQSIPAGVPLELLTFRSGAVREYSTPTTARTTLYGNTAYTTINPGGSYVRDSRCTLQVVLLRSRVYAYDFRGEGC